MKQNRAKNTPRRKSIRENLHMFTQIVISKYAKIRVYRKTTVRNKSTRLLRSFLTEIEKYFKRRFSSHHLKLEQQL